MVLPVIRKPNWSVISDDEERSHRACARCHHYRTQPTHMHGCATRLRVYPRGVTPFRYALCRAIHAASIAYRARARVLSTFWPPIDSLCKGLGEMRYCQGCSGTRASTFSACPIAAFVLFLSPQIIRPVMDPQLVDCVAQSLGLFPGYPLPR